MNEVGRSEREDERLYQSSVFIPTTPVRFHIEVFSHASQFITGNSEFIKPVMTEKSESRENKGVDWAWGGLGVGFVG